MAKYIRDYIGSVAHCGSVRNTNLSHHFLSFLFFFNQVQLELPPFFNGDDHDYDFRGELDDGILYVTGHVLSRAN